MSISEQPRVNGHPQPVKLVKVHPQLPAQDSPEAAPEVVQGTVVATSTRRQRRALRAVRAIRRTATGERTLAGFRLAARHGMYVVSGANVLRKRAWDNRTAARYERMIRAAEIAGKTEEALEWESRLTAYRNARHRRRMDLIKAPIHFAIGTGITIAVSTGVLLILGIILAISEGRIADVIAPISGVIDTIAWICAVIAAVWPPFLHALPFVMAAVCYQVGRKHGQTPVWLLPPGQGHDGGPITPSIVVLALRDLGISPLRKAIQEMGDLGAQMLGPIRIAGCGVEVDVSLPIGVSTDEIQGRRRKLAENLNRHEHEVFITIPQAARTVRLWIADSGALDEPIGPSPLVMDETLTANYKTGRAPWGQDLRGDAAAISLYQRHLLITGLSNQGKTVALRALALWLALDPTVEFRVGDLKGVGDWKPMDGIATVLIEGPTDEHVAQVTEMVEGGVREMERRLQAGGTDFPPLILLVDEAQVAFMCPEKDELGRPYGGTRANSRYFKAARKIHNQGRAVNVLLWQGTQDPTDQNLPKLVREGAHIRASLALGTESQSRMALGDKAVDGGAAPHLLRQGLDKGTLVVSAGDAVDVPAGQVSLTIRTHYIPDQDADAVAERAKALRSGVMTRSSVAAVRQADPLADIAAVLGDVPRMRTQEVLQRLAERNPGEYRDWKFGELKDVLDAVDAAPHKSDGVMVVDRQKILDALAQRPESDPEDES